MAQDGSAGSQEYRSLTREDGAAPRGRRTGARATQRNHGEIPPERRRCAKDSARPRGRERGSASRRGRAPAPGASSLAPGGSHFRSLCQVFASGIPPRSRSPPPRPLVRPRSPVGPRSLVRAVARWAPPVELSPRRRARGRRRRERLEAWTRGGCQRSEP